MKKHIILLSAVILTFSVMSGCNDKPVVSSEQVQETQPETAEPTTKTIYEIDPFEGLDFVYHHDDKGAVKEKSYTYSFKSPESLLVDNVSQEIQTLSDDHLSGIKQCKDLGCYLTIYREVLDQDLKDNDTVTYRLFWGDKIIVDDKVASDLEEIYGIKLTQTTKKVKVSLKDEPVTEVDPFEKMTVSFGKYDGHYTVKGYNYKYQMNSKIRDLDLDYSMSLVEGKDINDLFIGDKVKFTLTMNVDGKEYRGEEINKYLEDNWKRIHLTQTEKVYDVAPSSQSETYSKNVNVMMNRSDDWYQIAWDNNKFSKYDLRHIDGSTATIPITAELVRQFCGIEDNVINYYIDHNTTSTAYENLILGKDDTHIILVTEPSDEELTMASENNVELDVEKIALDGFVFITHKDNPVESLTIEQIQDIYGGYITNWAEVGGYDEEIVPYVRTKNSGSQTAMENMVMQGLPMITHPDTRVQIATDMGGLIDSIASYTNSYKSIGYTFNYYINDLYKSDDIKVLRINDIAPEYENFIDGSYPLTSGYYAVTVRGADQKAEEIKEYLLSDEGQELIQLAGYCPIR